VRCLSLWQPWASLIAVGQKKIETRHWSTSYRGPLAIHAALKWNGELREICQREPFWTVIREAGYGVKPLPLGAIIATCRLTDCMRTDVAIEHSIFDRCPPHERWFGDFSYGRWAWILEDVRALPEPIPAKGSQGLWDYDLQAVTV